MAAPRDPLVRRADLADAEAIAVVTERDNSSPDQPVRSQTTIVFRSWL